MNSGIKSYTSTQNSNAFYFGVSKKICGIGFIIDFCPPIAIKEKLFELQLDLLWVRFWWIRYKRK